MLIPNKRRRSLFSSSSSSTTGRPTPALELTTEQSLMPNFWAESKYNIKDKSSHFLHHESHRALFQSLIFSDLWCATSICSSPLPSVFQTVCCTGPRSKHIRDFATTFPSHKAFGYWYYQPTSASFSLSAPHFYK